MRQTSGRSAAEAREHDDGTVMDAEQVKVLHLLVHHTEQRDLSQDEVERLYIKADKLGVDEAQLDVLAKGRMLQLPWLA
jgi:hypothetical protein